MARAIPIWKRYPVAVLDKIFKPEVSIGIC